MGAVVVLAAMGTGYLLGRSQPLRDARARARHIAGQPNSSTADRCMYLALHPLTGWAILRDVAR